MKHYYLSIFLVILLSTVCTTSFAHDIEVVNSDGKTIYYIINDDGNTLTVSFRGNKPYSYENEYTGDVDIPETITYSGKTYSVTSIGEDAFWGCSSLTSVTIPNSVTSIGEDAFWGCSSLTSVIIPNSVTSIGYSAFWDCSSLASVTIPNSVTTIGYSAFCGCSSLTSVIIPNSVTTIGEDAFSGCSGLTSVNIPNSVTSIGNDAFYGTAWYDNQPEGLVYVGDFAYKYKGAMSANTSITLKEGTIGIASSAFCGCSGLTSVSIPNSVVSIGADAFLGTAWYNNKPDGLVYAGNVAYKYKGTMPANTSITFKEGTVGIASSAFSDCSGLTSITIPNSVTGIGSSAFSGCSGLTSVTIPKSVTSIGDYAFYDCSGLAEIKVANGNSVYDSRNNCYAIIKTSTNTLIVGCKNTIIPESVTSIGYSAFSDCSGLTSVTIPNSVTSIGDWAFEGCSGLAEIKVANGNSVYDSRNNCNAIIKTSTNTLIVGCKNTIIPNSVTSIGEEAFRSCSGLTSVTIPNSVTSIGSGAFNDCI